MTNRLHHQNKQLRSLGSALRRLQALEMHLHPAVVSICFFFSNTRSTTAYSGCSPTSVSINSLRHLLFPFQSSFIFPDPHISAHTNRNRSSFAKSDICLLRILSGLGYSARVCTTYLFSIFSRKAAQNLRLAGKDWKIDSSILSIFSKTLGTCLGVLFSCNRLLMHTTHTELEIRQRR